jgi:flagellar protein FliO/FliZ
MQFLTSLFGGFENTLLTAVLALGIVLVLIVLGVWVLKVFFKASNNLVRGRNKRLTIIDSIAVDPKRQLLIIRRDNVEHLILTGGPQDLVVEAGIAVERPSPIRRPVPHATTETAATPAAAERPAPSQPVTDALQAAQALASGPAPVRGPMDRLRDLGRPLSQRKDGAPSLRHTGLMRPVSRMEPAAVIPINPDNSDHRRVDSAKTSAANDTNRQGRLGAGKYLGDGFKAEGS